MAGALGLAACREPLDDPSELPPDPPPIAQQDITDTDIDPITDVVVIMVADPTSFAGRPVRLSALKVQTVLGPRTFWAGPNPNQRVLVALQDSARSFDIEPGQLVTLSGTVESVPANVGVMRVAWSLSAADEAALADYRIYIAADSVQTMP